jgi:SPP1 gp7 family putative phage head morphogenesis protein
VDLTDLSRGLDAPRDDAFDVTPEDALRYWRGKGLRTTWGYGDMAADEHRVAFTVAKMMDTDLLKDVYDSLDEAIAQGVPFRQWADEMIPLLRTRGWYTDGMESATGRPYRVETIFRTNLQSAYAQGQWDLIEAQAAEAPFLLYDAVDDFRTRPEHAAWDGTVLPVTSTWWRTHTPPCGYNCRCGVVQLDRDDVEALGLEVKARSPRVEYRDWKNPRTGQTERIPVGVDPGFGQAAVERVARIERLHGEKIRAMTRELRQAAQAGAAATAVACLAATAAVVARERAERLGDAASAYVREKGVQAGNSIEYAVVFDEDTGAEILRKRGGRSHVNFNEEQVGAMRAAGGAVMYHNHPSGYSLSSADLLFGKSAGLRRIVAVSNDHSSEYHASEFGDADRIKAASKAADAFVYDRVGELHRRGLLNSEQANHLHSHLVNVLIGQTGLVKYEARILPPVVKDAMPIAGLRYDQWLTEWRKSWAP